MIIICNTTARNQRLTAPQIETLMEDNGFILDKEKSNQLHKGQAVQLVCTRWCKKLNGDPLRVEDFPVGFTFGNGVTVNKVVKLVDGHEYFLTWIALHTSESATHRLKLILDYIEGGDIPRGIDGQGYTDPPKGRLKTP